MTVSFSPTVRLLWSCQALRSRRMLLSVNATCDIIRIRWSGRHPIITSRLTPKSLWNKRYTDVIDYTRCIREWVLPLGDAFIKLAFKLYLICTSSEQVAETVLQRVVGPNDVPKVWITPVVYFRKPLPLRETTLTLSGQLIYPQETWVSFDEISPFITIFR